MLLYWKNTIFLTLRAEGNLPACNENVCTGFFIAHSFSKVRDENFYSLHGTEAKKSLKHVDSLILAKDVPRSRWDRGSWWDFEKWVADGRSHRLPSLGKKWYIPYIFSLQSFYLFPFHVPDCRISKRCWDLRYHCWFQFINFFFQQMKFLFLVHKPNI